MRKMLIAVTALCAAVVAGVVLFRSISSVSVKTEGNDLPEIPGDAELVYLDWTQTSSIAEDCFFFRMRNDGGIRVMSGSYIDAVSHDSVEMDDVPVSDKMWRMAEECLRENTHRAPVQLSKDVEALDGVNSELTVQWQCPDGSIVSAEYDGVQENELRGILSEILKNSK